MSRLYKVFVEIKSKKITSEILNDTMCNKFGYTDEDNDEFEGIISYTGEGSLYGGMSEEDAHNEIYAYLKTLDTDTKIRTTWTYLEELPSETYGDSLDGD